MSVLDTIGMINKATGFNQPASTPAPLPMATPMQPISTPLPPAQPQPIPHSALAPLQLFHQTFMASPSTNMPPPTSQNAMDQISAIMAQNQQTMAQNEAAIQSGQHHLLQPLQMLPQIPEPALKKLPIYTNK